jgi:rubrerythrin
MGLEKNFRDMLISSLEMEEKGYDFYQAQAAKSKNNIAKDMFSFLANNELYHIENIKIFYDALKQGSAPAISDLQSQQGKRIKELDIFSRGIDELDGKISPDDDDKKACEFAMRFEKDGYDYYKNMLEKAETQEAKDLMTFLLEEESRHYEIIEKMYNYLTDSANWFMYEEGSFPQG